MSQGTDVALSGGADTAQQCLSAGLIDEMELHIVPMVLGAGAVRGLRLEPTRRIWGRGVTHVKYRIVK